MAGTVSDQYQTPEIKHLYQNYLSDSLRWNFFTFRDDDIVIATSGKTGTTWTQWIVANLIFLERDLPATPVEMSPWLDFRIVPLELVLTQLEQQTHRRFIKTHLPLDGLRYDQRVRYLYVGRDTRDVFMSAWNHYRSFTEAALSSFNTAPGRIGPELPPCPDDIHDYWRIFMTQGWFDWESEGYPFSSPLYHAQSWWDFRHLPNILFVHYADLLADFHAEAQRIADFLGIQVPERAWPAIIRSCTLSEMRAKAPHDTLRQLFKGGAETFFYRGTNNRWKEVLSADELALYEAAAKRVPTLDCRRWLENGKSALC
jgi:aryl sulfotransferase